MAITKEEYNSALTKKCSCEWEIKDLEAEIEELNNLINEYESEHPEEC